MPDRHTGQPRPPRAAVGKAKTTGSEPWNARRVPQPPEGEGPALEWCYSDRNSQFAQLTIMLVIFIVFLTILDGGFEWMRIWYLWAIVLVGGLVALAGARTDRYSAGADWLMHRKDFVKIYELSSIKYEKDFGYGNIDLDDRHGGGAKASLTTVWRYPDLWDLVYNGIRHSVANGAQVNDLAVERLRLFDVALIGQQRRGERRPGD